MSDDVVEDSDLYKNDKPLEVKIVESKKDEPEDDLDYFDFNISDQEIEDFEKE